MKSLLLRHLIKKLTIFYDLRKNECFVGKKYCYVDLHITQFSMRLIHSFNHINFKIKFQGIYFLTTLTYMKKKNKPMLLLYNTSTKILKIT